MMELITSSGTGVQMLDCHFGRAASTVSHSTFPLARLDNSHRSGSYLGTNAVARYQRYSLQVVLLIKLQFKIVLRIREIRRKVLPGHCAIEFAFTLTNRLSKSIMWGPCGSNSMAECLLPKQDVASSSLVSRLIVEDFRLRSSHLLFKRVDFLWSRTQVAKGADCKSAIHQFDSGRLLLPK